MPDDEFVIIDCVIEAATAEAVLVEYEGETEWIPRTCIEDEVERDYLDYDELSIRTWKLDDLGWL
jgi:hypothetical protein